MDFSDLYKQTNSNLVSFSPDGKYLAIVVEHRLIIRNSDSPKTIHRVFSCTYDSSPFIQDVGWSSDSLFIFTASYELNRVDVWCLADESWRCSIVDQVSFIENAMWAPHGRHVLTFSELDLRLSIWSIEDGDERQFIQYPKSRAPPAFHPEGDYMAVAQRHDYHDYIGIYNTRSWTMVREIAVMDTVDLAGIAWSPDGLHLVAWDMAGNFCAVVVNVGGVVKRVYGEDQVCLGVRSCEWAPSGQLLAVGGYDEKIRMLNHLTWRPLSTLVHRAQGIPSTVDVFNEVEIGQSLALESRTPMDQTTRVRSRFVLGSAPSAIRVALAVDVHRAERKLGVSVLVFSADGEFLASVCESMPNAVWIWKVDEMRLLAVVQTLRAVRTCKWSPVERTLAIATGSSSVYLWKQEAGCFIHDCPSATATVAGLVWNPNGDTLAVLSKGMFMLGFLGE
ncbi:WD repeat-containing protein wrap73 [Coemansia sp. RSA 2050]|nr:WD repeat-containing protein wrap73 [Coemansia sp. RSA 2050]KAJ2736001.1 WD repeat-containing protein wrap73 [Coemansia sp. BCRC 34962]